MNKKNGFTLTEILISVVILAVLAAVSIPAFTGARNRASAKQAASYLRTIRTSQKMYYAKWGTYLQRSNSAEIKAELGAETGARDYDFSVAATATTFTATATKKGVPADTISLNQDGTFSATGNDVKYVPAS